MSREAILAFLYQLNPIVSSQRSDDPSMIQLPGQQGLMNGTYNLRLAAAVDAVGWDKALELGEIQRLITVTELTLGGE